MHCTLCYPTKYKDANLSALIELNKKFPNYILGLSDHTIGTIASSASILLGTRVIEKHFTINKKLKKSADHWLSIDPKELKKLREDSDNLIKCTGITKKRFSNVK